MFFFFFNDTATTEIYTLSLHDALPISHVEQGDVDRQGPALTEEELEAGDAAEGVEGDRKSTRLNSSHSQISYAVFCLKKKTEPRRSGRTADSNGPLHAAHVPRHTRRRQ